jgi:DNA-binding phage protein
MRKIFTQEEYQEFAKALRQAIQERNLSRVAAAEVLGITRQCLHLYLSESGHQPRRRVLERACRAWGLSFVAQGRRFDKNAFGADPPLEDPRPAVQLLLLPDAIDRLQDSNLGVKIIRKEPGRIQLQLEVKFSV